jgi:hypothetical protein
LTGDLELELRHASHLSLHGTNLITTDSLWHDDLWRLRIRHPQRSPYPDPSEPRQYRIEVGYTSQLSVLERRIATSFLHDGFEVNYNRQQYIQIHLISSRIEVSFRDDFRSLYGLETYEFDVGPLTFEKDVFMTSLRLDVGAGPAPLGGGNQVFFSVRAEFPAVGVSIDVPGPNPHRDLPPFFITGRFFLDQRGPQYVAVVESTLLDQLDFEVHIPDPGEIVKTVNVKQFVKKKIEDALYKLQFSENGHSKFGEFLKAWLVGGRRDLFSLAYAPGPNDALRPDGIAELATGELIVRYVGLKPKPSTVPVLEDPTHPSEPPPDDGSIRLFDLPDEEPAPEPGGGGGGAGGVTPGPIHRPNIGHSPRLITSSS